MGFDSTYYEIVAKVLEDGYGYVDPSWFLFDGSAFPSALFPPGFPLLLAALARLGLAGSRSQNLLVGVALGTVNVVLVWHIARQLLDRRVALLAALIMAADPLLIGADGALMAEPLGLLLTLVVVDLLVSRPDGSLPRWFLVGLLGGFAVLVRGEGLAVVGALVGVGLWRGRRLGGRRLVVGALTCAGAVALVVGPWILRNHHRFDRFVYASSPSTVIGGANCPSTYYGRKIGFWDHACLGLDRPGAQTLTELEVNDRIRNEGLSYAAAHSGRLFVVVPVRVLRTWAAFGPSNRRAGRRRRKPGSSVGNRRRSSPSGA